MVMAIRGPRRVNPDRMFFWHRRGGLRAVPKDGRYVLAGEGKPLTASELVALLCQFFAAHSHNLH